MTLAALALAGLLSTAPPAQDLAGFAGSWERDREKSDDAEEKMQAAFQQMRERMERGRSPRGPGGPPPGGGGPFSRERPRGAPRSTSIAEEIHIEVEGIEFRIDDGERVRIYFLDGKKHQRQRPDGTKLETVAGRQGSSVLIEEKFERGKIEQKLELGGEERTLVVTAKIQLEGMKDPVVIRSVYDRVSDGGF